VTTANFDENDPESMKREIERLNARMKEMRRVLWEWNVSSGPVWDYWKLKKAGEMESDYAFIEEEEYEPQMPLYDDLDELLG